MDCFWSCWWWSLKTIKLSCTPLLSRALSHGILPSSSLKMLAHSPEVQSWRSCCLLCSLLSGSWTPPSPCSLQPKLLPIFTSLTSSFLFVSMRCNRARPLVSLSTCFRKLSPMPSGNLLDCLSLAVLPFQQIMGWLKSPRRTRACECEASSCLKRGTSCAV